MGLVRFRGGNGAHSAELWPAGAASFQAEQGTAIFIPGDTNSVLKRAEFLKCPHRPGCFITKNPAGCSQAGWMLQSSTKTFLGLYKLPVSHSSQQLLGPVASWTGMRTGLAVLIIVWSDQNHRAL